MNVIVELVDQSWHVVAAGQRGRAAFSSGAKAFEAASRLVCAAPAPAAGAEGGRITVRAFGTSVETPAVV